MRKIVIRSLSMAGGADIVEAEDGDEAVSLFKAGQFDLVLADWRMPKQTGVEVARQIRRSDRQVPIVLMSTELEPYPEAEAADVGVTDRLIKPFTPEAIGELLKKHCPSEPKAAASRRRKTTAS
jgi:two-component system chemotaxis response regulator CheY